MSIKRKSEEQKFAEAEVEEFKEDLGPFVVAAETTRMAMVFTDAKAPNNPIIFANDSFLKLTGNKREEVLGQNFNFLMAKDSDPEALTQIETAFKGNFDNDPEIRCCRKDGSMFWTIIFISPVHDENGDVVQHFASFQDITKQREQVDRLRFLLDELNHRTQNTLASVLAITMQTLRGEADNAVVHTLEERILALSKAHGLLGRENWDRITLRDVIDQTVQSFGLNERRVSPFSVNGDDVLLQPNTVLTFAMVFHELATNAAKHGALSNNTTGKIDINWYVNSTSQGDRLRLRWQESGGPSVTPPAHKGFGSRVIERGLTQELKAEISVTYEPSGLIYQIDMPVPLKGTSHE